MKFDADEKELLESVERGEWKSAGAGGAIQKRALAERLPYRTLISSLLYKYAVRRLKEL